MSGIDGRTASSFDALELLANPTRLQAKIDALKAAEESAREQITLAGPASEIVKIRSEIDALKEEAAETLLQARQQAEDLVAIARENAKQLMADTHEEAAKILASTEVKVNAAEAKLTIINQSAAAIEEDRKKVAARVEQLNGVEQALQQKADALDKRAQELEGEKVQLVKVRELISQVV